GTAGAGKISDLPPEGIEQVGPAHQRGDRETASHGLAQHDHVGPHFVAAEVPPAARAPESGLHLVRDVSASLPVHAKMAWSSAPGSPRTSRSGRRACPALAPTTPATAWPASTRRSKPSCAPTPRSSSKTSATASGSATTQNAPDNPLARPPLFPG